MELTRREAIGLLGTAGAASLFDLTASAQTPSVPRGAIIRTLLKDVPPESLAGGPTLFHEHLSINISQQPNAAPHYTADVAEARAAANDGIACIVDGGHSDMRRDLAALRRIATESGLPIVASGGYYMQRTYPPDIARKSADHIADDLVTEANAQRLGAFGEIGQQGGVLTADERRMFEAIGKAHVRTGLPVFTHNPYTGKRQTPVPVPRDAALRQLDILQAQGVRLQNIAIGHVCCLDDPAADIAIQLAKRGVFVGFDRVTLEAIMPDADRVAMIMAMVNAGYADHVLLSSDFYSEPALKKNGGPGLAQAATVFAPMLLKAGMPEITLRRIFIDNPRRFLSFTPKSS